MTSTAIMMVSDCCSIFTTLGFIDFKQIGVGLATTISWIDATVLRGDCSLQRR